MSATHIGIGTPLAGCPSHTTWHTETKDYTESKAMAKEGKLSKVVEQLRPYTEPEEIEDQNAPVRTCVRYIDNRPGQ